MYSSYKRIISYFPNTDMEAKGKPGPDELKLLEPFRDKLARAVFDEPYVPLESDGSLQPHPLPFIQNLGKLGIQATYRIVDPAQYKSRTDAFDFDVVTAASGGTLTPGVDLRTVFTSESAKQNASRNLAGVSDPVVDALVDAIANAKSRDELNAGARALDRVLRAGHYWVPMWYRDTAWVAH